MEITLLRLLHSLSQGRLRKCYQKLPQLSYYKLLCIKPEAELGFSTISIFTVFLEYERRKKSLMASPVGLIRLFLHN